ncbi:MAG: hypothetical protein NTY38_24840 [Acidobacteria bacterium]|nr:hypothetical protein [Acidobacteriota bacterium]
MLAYADESDGAPGDLFAAARRHAMTEAIDEVAAALRTLGRPAPFGPGIKAGDDFLTPLFKSYFEKSGLRNLMQKTDFHVLARFVPRILIDPEITEKLNQIVAVADQARPAG